MDKRLNRTTNDQLRDIPCDPVGLKQYISELNESLKTTTDKQAQVKLLGEMGVHLRSLGELESAKAKLLEALKIIQSNQLGIKYEIQQKIRLAHVLQWQSLFEESNALFQQIISVCRADELAKSYLDFALQHSGKNLFEQKRFVEALTQFEEAMQIRIKRNAPIDQIESTKLAILKTKSMMTNGVRK
jgi:tetratricopeptide (TPR) repeat protein